MHTKYRTMSDTGTQNGLTLVLIGFQGSGKSATGNTILKHKCFRTGMGTVGSTGSVESEKMIFDQQNVTVVDTPPLSSKESFTFIRTSLSNQQQANAVYAIVITIGRFTEAEKIVVGRILDNSDSRNIMKGRTMLIFTREDELRGLDGSEDNKLEEWLNLTPTIKMWIHKYNIPYFAIENKSKDQNTDAIMKAAVTKSRQHSKSVESNLCHKVVAVIFLVCVAAVIIGITSHYA